MNKILATLLIGAALSSTSAFAEDKFRVSMENGKPRIDFSLNGNDKCVMIDDRIHCAPMPKAPGDRVHQVARVGRVGLPLRARAARALATWPPARPARTHPSLSGWLPAAGAACDRGRAMSRRGLPIGS